MNDWYRFETNVIAGSSGPELGSWDYQAIRHSCFKGILSVNSGDGVRGAELVAMGVNHCVIPMSANAPARPGDLEWCLANLPLAKQAIERLTSNGPMVVHCHSGKDRAGMVLAAYLIQFQGMTVEQAMERVLAVRSIAFTAPQYRPFAAEVLNAFKRTVTIS
ncbi:MAG: hypothetical protein ACI8XC_004217 [Gammaproteobacteria bacterium]|jgi:hypothetical protein